jgi:protein involved in polysaccharide export with SLBB domain
MRTAVVKGIKKTFAENRGRLLFVPIGLLFLTILPLGAQEEGTRKNQIEEDNTQRTQLALSSPDYPVTAGDIYTLSYAANGSPVTYTIAVDSSYRVRISNMGIINAEGKTFRQLKTDAEAIVANNYPLSGVQMVLSQPGLFKVFVVGEVKTAEEVSTWALARLSSLTGYMTSYASFRNVTVKSRNGQEKTYDLFRAERLGDLTQNPYLRPDDVITFNRFERQVTINGAVERPGIYQLLTGEHLKDLIETYAHGFAPLADKTRMELVRFMGSASVSGDKFLLKESDIGENYVLMNYDVINILSITENRPVATVDRLERHITLEGAVRRPGTYDLLPDEHLRDLIEVYGDGFTPLADKTRLELIRYVNTNFTAGEKISIGQEELDNNYPLENYDTVFIYSLADIRPVFFIEGAVREATEETVSSEPSVSRRMVIPFNRGEYYSSVIRKNSRWFFSESDTRNAYIIRAETQIPINLNRALYDVDWHGEILIEENDVLIIPFKQYFVTVAGAVEQPGRYPYIPDRDGEYYVALAGGLIPGRNSFETLKIRDINGKSLKKTDAITPETIITAPTNHFLYYFNQFAPVLTTVLSIVTTVISISLLAR